jgi:hypothetical protein
MKKLYTVAVNGRPVLSHSDPDRAADYAQRLANKWWRRGAVVSFHYPGGHSVTWAAVIGAN